MTHTLRIVILGPPRTGKTQLAAELERALSLTALHTDDTIGMQWSEASAAVARWFAQPQPWLIEGVACARALRKWCAANRGRPCDLVVVLDDQRIQPSTPGQHAMAKGCRKVWAEIAPELSRRGVEFAHGRAAALARVVGVRSHVPRCEPWSRAAHRTAGTG